MERERRPDIPTQQQDDPRRPPPAAQNRLHQPPPHRRCQRCGSPNTKFCYYNNYSLSQPRYFCKACRRYWTHGGSLRNVPVGGARRSIKRSKTSTGSSEIASQPLGGPLPPVVPPMADSFYIGGAFIPGGTNQWTEVNLGGGEFGANMTLLQQMSGFPSLNSQAAREHFIPPRPLSSWTQGLTNTGGASGSGYRSCSIGGGGDLVCGSNFSLPSQRSDAHPGGFNPSQFSVITNNFNADMHDNEETSNF